MTRGTSRAPLQVRQQALSRLPFSFYTFLVDTIVEFNAAAFKHDIKKEDILYALKNKVVDAAIEGLADKYGVIGFDRAGNPLEVMYNPIDDNSINVFHAMKLRKSFIQLLDI